MRAVIEKVIGQMFPPSLPEIEDAEELDAWISFHSDVAGRIDPYQRPMHEAESSARLVS